MRNHQTSNNFEIIILLWLFFTSLYIFGANTNLSYLNFILERTTLKTGQQ